MSGMASCHGCDLLATDPGKGPSTWTRAVLDRRQILLCPDCRAAWIERVDRCPSCDSPKLHRALGDTVCRACHDQWPDVEFSL